MNGTALVKYHNRRMLFTLDMSILVKVLLDECGPSVTIQLEEMTSEERAETLEEVNGLHAVRERFWLFIHVSEDWIRRPDLERVVVDRGQK